MSRFSEFDGGKNYNFVGFIVFDVKCSSWAGKATFSPAIALSDTQKFMIVVLQFMDNHSMTLFRIYDTKNKASILRMLLL